MLFNSFPFAVFLIIVFIAYWFIANKSLKAQNILLLLASYFFYSCWDWRFLFLLIFSTFLDYFTGLKIHQAPSQVSKKAWLFISVIINLGFLACFKYYNFFSDSFASMLQSIGFQPHFSTLNIILPVGISFYTFHGLSYVINIYKSRIKPCKNPVDYFLFVGFFPLLVAGPIERATHLLPQVQKPRTFDYVKAVDGLRQILWGLFKKIVIADGCAEYANMIFNNPSDYSGSSLIIGVVLFAFQIYGDFSGYSDIALGTARLLGFELLRNFAFPYFSRDIAEFWRRWHISLSSWFRDYLYIPLGGSKGSPVKNVRNMFIVFIVSGLWHGANYTFVAWGTLNALFFLPLILFKKNRTNIQIVAQGKFLPSIEDIFKMATTFSLICFAWIFFRAESMSDAFYYISRILSKSLFDIPVVISSSLIFFIAVFLIVEWTGREQQYALANIELRLPKPLKWAFYYCIICALFIFSGKEQPFIYFQF